jgi:2-C-methyl-D-erythritol 4-phosphate cytidylyltransferase
VFGLHARGRNLGESAIVNPGIVCVAGGSGARFGGDKLAETVDGRTVLESSLRALVRAFPDAPLVLVVPHDRMSMWADRLTPRFPELCIVAGGSRRQDSVRFGVAALPRDDAGLVAVHDGARPLLHPDDFRSVVEAVGDAVGAVLCGRVSDTVKRVTETGVVVETVDRSSLRLIQTPQVFRREALENAWRAGDMTHEWTDEAALLESLGMTIRTCLARHPNWKLTTAEDLGLIRALFRERSR